MTTDHALSTEKLTLGYGDRVVIESLDLVIPPGRITAIVGANACGKSTLLRGCRGCSPRAPVTSLLDGRDGAPDAGQGTRPYPRAAAPVTRSRRRASPWPTWSAGAATRTSGCCPAGRRGRRGRGRAP